MTASNLLVVDSEGHVVRGQGEPEATAFYIHSVLVVKRHATKLYGRHIPFGTSIAVFWCGKGCDSTQAVAAHKQSRLVSS